MMQETELKERLSSLDRIAPPSGTRERLLKEKILTKSEMPVNDSHSETSVFSIIEDKRSDIIPPETVSEELPDEKEKEHMGTSPDAKGETALFKQPKFLLGFGIAAACIAVIAIGALAISIFTGKSKLDTSPADSGNGIADKIMSAGESIYSKLDTYKEFPYKESDEGEITDERKEFKKEDIGNAAKCYRLANGYYLLLADKEEFGAVLLDNEKNIVAENIAWSGYWPKPAASSERYIFTGQLESSENQPNSHLTIGIADIDSPDALSEDIWCNDGFASININDYAEGGEICSYKVVPYDMSVHKENPDDPESIDIASCYFAANYTNADGVPEGAVYRADSGHGKAELIYTLKNKKEGDEVKRLEGVYAPESLNELTNIYAVYSKSTKETNYIGLYEKEYYVVAIDPKGKSEPVETKLFDAADDPYALTFERDYTAICSTNVFCISFLNKNTGLITIVQDYSIIMKDGANIDGTTDRYLKLDVNRSLMTAPTYRYLSYSRFAACEETASSSFRQIMYTDENGRLETVNDYSEVPDNAIKIDSTEYICNRSVFFTRIDYGEDGKPISTLIALSQFGDTIDFDYSCSIEGAAISAENGKAIFDIDFDSGTSEQELKVHTPDAAYKKTLHS